MWDFKHDFNAFMIECNSLWKKSINKTTQNNTSTLSKRLVNMSNQYYLVISLPNFDIISCSENINQLFPSSNGNLSTVIESYYQDSFEDCFANFSHTIKNLIINSDKEIPLEVQFSSILKIKNSNKAAEYYLNQVCLLEKELKKGVMSILIQYTNVDALKSLIQNHTCPLIETQLKHNHDINVDNELLSQFTSREMEILELLQSGRSSIEIADMLNISKHTVDTHRRKMISKSNVCNTAELIAFCISQKTNISQ